MKERLAAISIDVDSLRHYRGIHGLQTDEEEEAADPIYTVALPRFWELLDGRPATLFLIGADAPAYPEAFRPLAERSSADRARTEGCEIASHSYAHDYRLTRLDPEAMHADLAAAEQALAPLAGGRRPVGFRAPGYNQDPALLRVLIERGYRYDASLLPAPAYFSARALAIGAYSLLGTPSASLVGRVQAFAGPLEPYRCQPDRYWAPSSEGALWELPIAVEPRTRWPLIGTTWVGMPGPLRRSALRALRRRGGPVAFEMHAIDLLDQSDAPALEALAQRQPDLKIPARDKLRRLGQLFDALEKEWRLLPLAAWPERLERLEHRA